jgi:protein OS-9
MATTDTIVFVKEAKTCSYVLVVHTPRLCGEPGFMSSKDAGEQARISCREIVAGEPTDQSDAAFIPDADHPLKMPRRKPVLPLPMPKLKESAKGATTGKYNDMILKALDSLKELHWPLGEVEMLDDGDGNIVIQFMEDVPLDGTTDQDALEEAAEQSADRIAQILREAGIDIKSTAAGKFAKNKKNGDEKQDENDAADRRREVDELAT